VELKTENQELLFRTGLQVDAQKCMLDYK